MTEKYLRPTKFDTGNPEVDRLMEKHREGGRRPTKREFLLECEMRGLSVIATADEFIEMVKEANDEKPN